MTTLDRRPPLSLLVWFVAVFLAALLLSTAGRYGIFRDEYYYLMCADHPAWGYVDHPPLAMVFLGLWKTVFGASVLALRIPPALLVGATSLGAGLLAREMRGGAVAQVTSAVAVGFMPALLAQGGFYSMNSFDVAFWVLIAWIVCRLLDPAADRRWWWGAGLAVGLGLLNKYSVLFLVVGLGAGFVLSPLRRELVSRQRLTGSLIAFLLLLPHGIWQIVNGWPTLEFIRNAREHKIVAMSAGDFWNEQLLMAHPAYLPLWAIGLVGLLALPRLRTWRPLGVAFVVVAAWLTLSHAKPYYLGTAYPMLLAAGSVLVTDWLSRHRLVARVSAFALPLLVATAGLIVAPLAIPLLSPTGFVSWTQTLGLAPRNAEVSAVGALPQHFADRFGWEELAQTVRGVTDGLTPGERAACLVLAGNYGECGALNYWGLSEGVRPAVSGHNSCHGWWPADFAPDLLVAVGVPRSRLEEVFDSVEAVAVHRAGLAMPYESELTVWICRGWKVTPAEAREGARFYI